MLILLVWMMSRIEPRFHHREAIRPITVTRARYQVGYHHRLKAPRQNRLENPFFIESRTRARIRLRLRIYYACILLAYL